jgi:hypothetical protein
MQHPVIRDYFKGVLDVMYYTEDGHTHTSSLYLETVNDYKEHNIKQLWYNNDKCIETHIPWLYDAKKDALYICDSKTGVYYSSTNKTNKFSIIM